MRYIRYRRYYKLSVSRVLFLWFFWVTQVGGYDLINDFVPTVQKIDTLTYYLSEVVEMLIGVAAFLFIWMNMRLTSFGVIWPIKASEVSIKDQGLEVVLSDQRVIWVPLSWFPIIEGASPEQRQNFYLHPNPDEPEPRMLWIHSE